MVHFLASGNLDNRTRRMEANAELLKLRELKKRKVTRYDAEMIIQANQHLPDPSPTKAGPAQQTAPLPSLAKGPSASLSKTTAEESHICTDLFSTDSSSDLSASASLSGGKTVCSPSNPCVPRQRGKRTLSQASKSAQKRSRLGGKAEAKDENQPVVGEEAVLESENGECQASPRTGKNLNDPDLDLATGSTTVQSIPLSSHRNSVHTQSQSSFSQQPNGRLPSPVLKAKALRGEPVRQSPRLRPRHLPGQRPTHYSDSSCSDVLGGGGAYMNGGIDFGDHPPLDSDLDNDDSGLGEMTGDVFDKSLDSNHNFHDPPVLEREVPYVSSDTHAAFSAFPGAGEEESDQEVNKSSSSVPQLPFCGPAMALNETSHECISHIRSPKGKQKPAKKLHIRIKLKHPNQHQLLDFNQQLERDGKSQFVQIEPKESQSVKPTSLTAPQARSGFEPARPAWPGIESVQPPVRLRLRSDKSGKVFQCLSPNRTATLS